MPAYQRTFPSAPGVGSLFSSGPLFGFARPTRHLSAFSQLPIRQLRSCASVFSLHFVLSVLRVCVAVPHVDSELPNSWCIWSVVTRTEPMAHQARYAPCHYHETETLSREQFRSYSSYTVVSYQW